MLAYYIGFSLCQGTYIESVIEPTELLVPYAAFWSGQKPNLVPFEAESQEEAIKVQKDTIAFNGPKFDGWSSGMEGLITLKNGSKSDVLVIEAQMNGMSKPFQVLQLFGKSPFRLTDLIFSPSTEVTPELRKSSDFMTHLWSGINAHPQGDECKKIMLNKA